MHGAYNVKYETPIAYVCSPKTTQLSAKPFFTSACFLS